MNCHTQSGPCRHQPQAALTKVCNTKYCMAINLLCSLFAISGEQIVNIVPDALLEELGDLRIGYAKLIYNYEKQLHHSPEAQEEFVKFLPRLFHKPVEDHSFQSHFNTLVEEEVSLFNVFYLKRICHIFPEDVR